MFGLREVRESWEFKEFKKLKEFVKFYHTFRRSSPSDVTRHALLSPRFICGGSDQNKAHHSIECKNKKEAFVSELTRLFPLFVRSSNGALFWSLACGRCWATRIRT